MSVEFNFSLGIETNFQVNDDLVANLVRENHEVPIGILPDHLKRLYCLIDHLEDKIEDVEDPEISQEKLEQLRQSHDLLDQVFWFEVRRHFNCWFDGMTICQGWQVMRFEE